MEHENSINSTRGFIVTKALMPNSVIKLARQTWNASIDAQNMFRCGLNKPRTRRANEKQHTSSTKMNNFLKCLATHRMGISMGPHGETFGDSPKPCRECAFASGLYFSLHSIREHHTDKIVKLFAFCLTHFVWLFCMAPKNGEKTFFRCFFKKL